MQKNDLRNILKQVKSEKINIEEALKKIQLQSLEDTLAGLNLDTARAFRTGLGEVVFAQNKSPQQLISALEKLSQGAPVLATRVQPDQMEILTKHFPTGTFLPEAKLFSLGKTLPQNPPWPTQGDVLVMTAGAADRPVALEAFGTLHFWGVNVGFISDVGVAGLHRLTPHLEAMHEAKLIIAVAGMEGALPGLLAGLVRCPVVAVPTSVGYGVGLGGQAALSSMLCTCVPGVAVCNIDNGFGAASFAAKCIGHTLQ